MPNISASREFAHGHDYGNSEICTNTTGHGLNQSLIIPSIYASGTWREVEIMAGAAGKPVTEYLQPGHYVLNYKNRDGQPIERIIGQKVLDDGLTPSTTRADRERYWKNGHNLDALKVSSASAIPDPVYSLYVVTGMPISLYTPENTQLVEEALMGTHSFKVNNVERTMIVKGVRVVAEGAGALIAYGSSKNSIQGVIDIGGQTSDTYVAIGQKPVRAACKSFDKGVVAASELFNNKFASIYGRNLSMSVCQLLMRQHVNHMDYSEIRDRDRHLIPPHDIAALIGYALETIGQEIATFVAQTWSDILYDMSFLLLVGGGAYYFQPQIAARFPFVQRVAAPEMANAVGYARLATGIMLKMGR